MNRPPTTMPPMPSSRVSLPERAMDLFMWRFSWFYGRMLCWRHLDGVYGRGLERTKALAAEQPIILACNHSAWWDGILLLLFNHWLDVRGRFMVAAESAGSMGFITSLGGIPVDRSSMAAMAAAMDEASDYLTEPKRSVLVFPQGRFRCPSARPLGLQRGVGLLQRLSKAPIVPVTITYHFLDHHLPACLLTFGEPIEAGRRDALTVLDERLTQGLDEHEAWVDLDERTPLFDVVLRSAIVPYERRLGARIYVAGGAQLRAVRRNVMRLLGRHQPD